MPVFSNVQIPTQSYKTHKEKGKHGPYKEQDKSPKPALKKQVYELPDKKFKIIIIRMFYELKKMIYEQNENNKEVENIKRTKEKFWS